MTIQTLVDCWTKSGQFQAVNPPATEAEIQAAEAKYSKCYNYLDTVR